MPKVELSSCIEDGSIRRSSTPQHGPHLNSSPSRFILRVSDEVNLDFCSLHIYEKFTMVIDCHRHINFIYGVNGIVYSYLKHFVLVF